MKIEDAKRKLTNIYNRALFIGDVQTCKYVKGLMARVNKKPSNDVLKKVEELRIK